MSVRLDLVKLSEPHNSCPVAVSRFHSSHAHLSNSGSLVGGGGARGTWVIVLVFVYDFSYFNIHCISHWPIPDTSAQTRTSGNEKANEGWMVEIIADPRVLTIFLRLHQQVPDSVLKPDVWFLLLDECLC